MDFDIPACKRPWNVPDTAARGVPGMERRNPPAYLDRDVAAVCLNCRRRRCESYYGCDDYQQALKDARKKSRTARGRKK